MGCQQTHRQAHAGTHHKHVGNQKQSPEMGQTPWNRKGAVRASGHMTRFLTGAGIWNFCASLGTMVVLQHVPTIAVPIEYLVTGMNHFSSFQPNSGYAVPGRTISRYTVVSAKR